VIESLQWGPDDTVAEAVRRGRTYILVNTLRALLISDQFVDRKCDAIQSWTRNAEKESNSRSGCDSATYGPRRGNRSPH